MEDQRALTTKYTKGTKKRKNKEVCCGCWDDGTEENVSEKDQGIVWGGVAWALAV
jgi:hypothetical protein